MPKSKNKRKKPHKHPQHHSHGAEHSSSNTIIYQLIGILCIGAGIAVWFTDSSNMAKGFSTLLLWVLGGYIFKIAKDVKQ